MAGRSVAIQDNDKLPYVTDIPWTQYKVPEVDKRPAQAQQLENDGRRMTGAVTSIYEEQSK